MKKLIAFSLVLATSASFAGLPKGGWYAPRPAAPTPKVATTQTTTAAPQSVDGTPRGGWKASTTTTTQSATTTQTTKPPVVDGSPKGSW